MKSNKKAGSDFEREFAAMLSDHGFWAHCLRDNANGQPFDLIACKNNIPYAFDCKVCTKGEFDLRRIEDNQINAMTLMLQTGNNFLYFAFQFEDAVYIAPFSKLMREKGRGVYRLSEEAIKNMRVSLW